MKLKKVLAVLMASAMILGMSMTTFATATTYDDAIRVYGVEAGEDETVTVNAYQIIDYDVSGKYVPVLENTISTNASGELAPSASDVLTLSGRLNELGSPVQLTLETPVDGGTPYYTSDEIDAGTWMIIVTGSNDYIYNPAIISVSQTPDGIDYGELNLDTESWVTDTDTWLKKSEPTIKKSALTSNVQGVQYGDIIQFQLKATIPSYASNKTDIVFTISDSLDGLELVVDEKHLVNATLNGSQDETLNSFVSSAFQNGEDSVSVAITGDEYIKNHGNEEVIITYYAKVTESAKVTVNELTNDATLTYSTESDTNSKTDQTKHYTFGIDTTFSGSTTTTDKTGEFIKIDESGNVSYTETPGEVTVTGGEALDGAVFELHIGSETGNLFADASGATQFITDNTGRLEIVGLDSDVDYYLVEVKAPTGYTINDKPVKIKINPTFDNKGNLTAYSVVIGEGSNSATTNYNYSYQDGKTTVAEEVGNPYGFKNSELSSLPSTGGIGTTIFTIGGCVIMITAAGLYFASRRKENK